MAAVAVSATRARGGGQRRPFAPVVVSSSPSPAAAQAENRLDAPPLSSSVARREREREPRRFGACAVGKVAGLGGAGGGKAAPKKFGSGSSPVRVSSKKTPAAAAKRAPGGTAATGRRTRLDSCAKKRSTPAAGASSGAAVERDDEAVVRAQLSSYPSSEAESGYDAPRAGASGAAEERDDEVVRAVLSYPCSEAEADQERRAMTMEEVMAGLPEPGEGRVKYLVDTFERLFSLRGGVGGGGPVAWNRGAAARRRRKDKLAAATAAVSCPATPRGAEEIDVSYPSIVSSSEVSFPVGPGVACILDASDRTRISRARGQRRQRPYNSTVSSEKVWSCSRKVTRVTAQQPFRLKTEQRGKAKEGNFLERLRKMQVEQERLRNPVAQGLPYTTDEPEIPAKPPTKEPTEPMDLVLHSDVRVVRRVEFDYQVAERISFMEEVKRERERQKKLDEAIEIKLLRKEQVPRAHPVPDFSKPFVPKRSLKLPTIPREPRFQSSLMMRISKAQ